MTSPADLIRAHVSRLDEQEAAARAAADLPQMLLLGSRQAGKALRREWAQMTSPAAVLRSCARERAAADLALSIIERHKRDDWPGAPCCVGCASLAPYPCPDRRAVDTYLDRLREDQT